MNCRNARKTLVDVELELAAPEARASLEAHLADCAACASLASRERALTADLASLRVDCPLPVDVSARVATRVAGLTPTPYEEVGFRQLAWSTTAAVAFGIALLFGLWQMAPGLWGLAGETRKLMAGAWAAVAGLLEPVAAWLATVVSWSGRLLATLGPVADTLAKLEPVVIVTIVACSLMMVSSIVLVVGRDLMRPRWIREESR
jgi:hypothetical protein